MKSWNEIRKAATAFSKRWRNAYDEKSQAQSFLKEFFAVFGVDAVTVATFEHRVKFADGSQGYADCFWQGKILVEMKSRGKDLDAAYRQAMEYVRSLRSDGASPSRRSAHDGEGAVVTQLPRAIVVSDFARIRFYDLSRDCAFTEFGLKDLRKYVTLFGYMIGAEDSGGTVYNYYSTGDPIFFESDTVPGVTTGLFHWPTLSWSWPFIDFNITAEEGSWQKQETHKGVEPIAGTLRGGWGFDCWYENVGGEPVQMYYAAAQANAMAANGSITNSPVFSYGGTPLNNRNASQDDIWLSLAKYVPAISSPVGGTAPLDANNINLNDAMVVARPNGWGRDHNVYEESWLHSDMKDMAYFYVHKLYEQLVTRGDIQ